MKFDELKVGRWYKIADPHFKIRKIVAIEGDNAVFLTYEKNGDISFADLVPRNSQSYSEWEETEEPLFAKKQEVIENEGVFYAIKVKGNVDLQCPINFITGKRFLSLALTTKNNAKGFNKHYEHNGSIFKIEFKIKATEIIEGVNDEI